MKLDTIDQILNGIQVFMPSGITAELSLDQEGNIIVKYMEDCIDIYTKDEFNNLINDGIEVIEPMGIEMQSCLMEDSRTQIRNMNKLDCIRKNAKDNAIRQRATSLIDAAGLGVDVEEETKELCKELKKDESLNEEYEDEDILEHIRDFALENNLELVSLYNDIPDVFEFVSNPPEIFEKMADYVSDKMGYPVGTGKIYELIEEECEEEFDESFYGEKPLQQRWEEEMQNYPIIDTADGPIYFEPSEDGTKIIYGTMTNAGIIPEGEIEYEADKSLDWHIQGLADEIFDKYGYPVEFLDESFHKYSVRYQEINKKDQIVTKEKDFKNSEARTKWIEKQEKDNPNWYGVLAYSDPKLDEAETKPKRYKMHISDVVDYIVGPYVDISDYYLNGDKFTIVYSEDGETEEKYTITTKELEDNLGVKNLVWKYDDDGLDRIVYEKEVIDESNDTQFAVILKKDGYVLSKFYDTKDELIKDLGHRMNMFTGNPDDVVIKEFTKQEVEEKLNESMEDIVTVVDIPLVTEKLYNKLVNALYGNKQSKNRDYEQQGNVLNFLQKIEDRIPLGCEFHTDLEDYGFTIDEINAIKKIVRDERVDESLKEEEMTLPRYSVIGMNLKRNEKEGIGIVWDKDFDDPREAMRFAQEKGKEEPQHVIKLIDTIKDEVLYNSQEKNESLNEEKEKLYYVVVDKKGNIVSDYYDKEQDLLDDVGSRMEMFTGNRKEVSIAEFTKDELEEQGIIIDESLNEEDLKPFKFTIDYDDGRPEYIIEYGKDEENAKANLLKTHKYLQGKEERITNIEPVKEDHEEVTLPFTMIHRSSEGPDASGEVTFIPAPFGYEYDCSVKEFNGHGPQWSTIRTIEGIKIWFRNVLFEFGAKTVTIGNETWDIDDFPKNESLNEDNNVPKQIVDNIKSDAEKIINSFGKSIKRWNYELKIDDNDIIEVEPNNIENKLNKIITDYIEEKDLTSIDLDYEIEYEGSEKYAEVLKDENWELLEFGYLYLPEESVMAIRIDITFDDTLSENIQLVNKPHKKTITEFYDIEGMDSVEMEIVDFGIDKSGGHRFELDGIEFYLGEDEELINAVDTCIEMEFFPEWEEQGLSSYNVDSVQYDEAEGTGTAYVGLFWDENLDESLNELSDKLVNKVHNKRFSNMVNAKLNGKNVKEEAKKFMKNTKLMAKRNANKEEQDMNEEIFSVNDMLTDINDLDFPQALADTVDTTEDGEIITLGKVVDEIKDMKDEIVDAVKDIKDAIEFSDEELEEVEFINDEEPEQAEPEQPEELEQEFEEDVEEDSDETEVEEEEELEESYKKYLRKGQLENLQQTKQQIDKDIRSGANVQDIKNNIILNSDDEKEEQQAKQYAADKLKESLFKSATTSVLSKELHS